MDLVNLKDDIDHFNKTTLPRLEAVIGQVVKAIDDFNAILRKLDGLSINFPKDDKPNGT